MPKKTRFDDYLVQAGFALDRKVAQSLILAGEARLNGHPAKPGDFVVDPAQVQVQKRSPYVSRGGEKLRGALDAFNISARDKVCIDIGSSTGGFTDCLLQDGAPYVFAVDVGKSLLDVSLRNDPRVRVLEELHFRDFDAALLEGKQIGLAVADVSFISIAVILPKLRSLLRADADALILIKPQFEATPKEAPGGFVRDESTRQEIIERIKPSVRSAGFKIAGIQDAVISGRGGNQETFFWLKAFR